MGEIVGGSNYGLKVGDEGVSVGNEVGEMGYWQLQATEKEPEEQSMEL